MLEVLSDEALMDLQLSLAAYTQIVMKSLCDTVPKLVYNQLVTKVCSCISSLFSLKTRCTTHNKRTTLYSRHAIVGLELNPLDISDKSYVCAANQQPEHCPDRFALYCCCIAL